MFRLIRKAGCDRICMILCIVSIVVPQLLFSQGKRDSLAAGGDEAVRVYLDCRRCDRDYFRTEIPFVNYVRDRQDAQVHLLVTIQRTGSGGREYTLTFIGQKKFVGMNDTLRYVSSQTDTDDEVRQGLVKTTKLGLIRFVARTPLAGQIQITHAQRQRQVQEAVRDKWNYWVFRVSMRSFFNGQKSTNSISLGGSLSANRITDQWKIRLSAHTNYDEDNFEVDNESIKSIARNYSFFSMAAKSLGPHWSAGVFASASSSIYDNTKLKLRAAPALEYNFFPYSESTRRELRVEYRVGFEDFTYHEETIFDKTAETLFGEQLEVTLETRQPWGNAELSLDGSHYFHDFSKNRLELSAELDLRLYKGFTIDLFGSITMIRDQLSLRKRSEDIDEVLLQRRELATSYRYWGSVRLSYTFGSIYSNIVNPRFGG